VPAISKTILKMNFNFNFKDMPRAAEASIRSATNARDRHHTGKSGIKRGSGALAHIVAIYRNKRCGELLFAVALGLIFLTPFARIVDVDVILNCSFSGLREIDFQMRSIASLVTLNHCETNQIFGSLGPELDEIPAFGQRLYYKVTVLVSASTLEKCSATSLVLGRC
jgi:hypothetical protein